MSKTVPGTVTDSVDESADDTQRTDTSDSAPYIPPPRVFDPQRCLEAWDEIRTCYRPAPEEEENPEDPAPAPDPGIPAITITDLASFAPKGSTVAGEPGNLGVAGLPTNLVAEADVQTQRGELFGYPISVRFTPATYTFVHGDGTAAVRTTGGESWDALGQAQFTPTATSHTYRDRGTFDARVDVSYTAEIDLGTGWFTIPGELDTTGPTQQIRVFEAHTALVAFTCAETPAAPGC